MSRSLIRQTISVSCALAVAALASVGARSAASDGEAPVGTTAAGPAAAPRPIEIDIRHGEPRRVIDGVGWVLGLPSKLLLLDPRASNHDVSEETIEDTAGFLEENGVDGVMIRVNQYDPLGEWRRLRENEHVGLGWRLTLGSLYTLGYSVLPGRLVGNDWYNPFTDTVHVYSDVPALAMEQAAHAADVREKSHPGLYSATRLVPLMGIVHEARAKQAVFEHVDTHGTPEEQAEARRVLHPQLGTELGGQAAVFVPQSDALLSIGGAAVGHVVGRYQARQIETGACEATPEHASLRSIDHNCPADRRESRSASHFSTSLGDGHDRHEYSDRPARGLRNPNEVRESQ